MPCAIWSLEHLVSLSMNHQHSTSLTVVLNTMMFFLLITTKELDQCTCAQLLEKSRRGNCLDHHTSNPLALTNHQQTSDRLVWRFSKNHVNSFVGALDLWQLDTGVSGSPLCWSCQSPTCHERGFCRLRRKPPKPSINGDKRITADDTLGATDVGEAGRRYQPESHEHAEIQS